MTETDDEITMPSPEESRAAPPRCDEYIAQLSPGHEPPEVVAAFGLEIARRINKPGRKPRR